MDTAQLSSEPSIARYANFPRRLNAISIDIIVLVAFSILVFTLASVAQSLTTVRVGLGVLWWVGIILYEPGLVSLAGGTVGHRLMNLRVVDNVTKGNVSLAKALGRYFFKAFLGVFSFLSMSFSKRHQAIHDIATNSSVRIRDVAKAKSWDYTEGPA